MINFDEQLSRLHGDVERYRRLEKERMELRAQIEELTTLADELDAVRLEEQADVDRLEGKTLTAFFFNLVGNIDEKLDKERREAYAAKVKYDTLERELADVDISEDMQVNVEGFLRFADYFFDGFFTDWTVLDKIHQAQSQVEHVSGTIERVISRLDTMLEQTETERCRTKERIDALVRDTRLPESEA